MSATADHDDRPRSALARFGRLALKELRETLRDRRTIITLVLMPLLVYPVLSLAFRQFLLSSFQQSAAMHWRLATTSQKEWQTVMVLLSRGHQFLQERQQSAAAALPERSGLVLGADLGENEPPLENIEVVAVPDLERAVTDQDIDLGIRLLDRGDAEGTQSQYAFQLVVRPGSPTSRQAASFVERRLRAVNEDYVRTRLKALGDSGRLPASWRLKPVGDEQGHSFWLGTLVPLVLILMTITGAVYPAIDLTAGERERGTLEPLMAAPVPRLALLLAKYVAVLTVAMLTAIVNLTAMAVTVASSGLGPILFGTAGLTGSAVLAVLALLALFAAFFSALLLSITSFARSFKEAQAYLIPLMLVSLAPGFFSVMPGLELGPLLSVLPLANIVLLARDVLEGDASPLWGAVAVLTTVLYGGLALALAARIFGSDAMLYGSQGSWTDLFRPPSTAAPQASLSGALATLALVTPAYIIASGLYAQMSGLAMPAQLMAAAGISLLLFLVLPLGMARLQGVSVREGFQLRAAPLVVWLGAALLGASLWALAYDLIVLSIDAGLATFSKERLEGQQASIELIVRRWRTLPPAAILAAFALVPAIAEEFFFRGYLLQALRGRLAAPAAIGLTSVVFGLFHATVGGLVTIEHVLGSTFLGLALGWVAWTARSALPGMLLHLLSNGIMLSIVYWKSELQRWRWDLAGQHYLPPGVLLTAIAVAVLGAGLVWLGRRRALA